MCAAVGQALDIPAREVLCASTGMIGRALPMDKLLPGIARIAPELARGKAADAAVARAIMTTDTVPKSRARRITVGDVTYTVGGTAKGSGMVRYHHRSRPQRPGGRKLRLLWDHQSRVRPSALGEVKAGDRASGHRGTPASPG
jgi:hypothetical protein